LRRIEDLQGEIQHLQTAKQDKEERLRAQVHKSEQLLSELERLSAELTQAKGDKEATIEARGAKERDLEHADRTLKRVRDRVDGLSKSIRSLERSILELCERQIIQTPVIPSSNNTRRSSSKSDLIEGLLDTSDQVVQALVEWSQSTLIECFQEAAQRLGQLKDELKHKDQVISSLENKCKRYTQDEQDLKQKEKFLATEVEDLRGKLRNKDEEKQESYTREERM